MATTSLIVRWLRRARMESGVFPSSSNSETSQLLPLRLFNCFCAPMLHQDLSVGWVSRELECIGADVEPTRFDRRLEIAAKHEGMNETSIPQSRTLGARSAVKRVTRLLQQAQDSLHSTLGTSPTNAEWAEWTGVSERTVQDWYNDKGRPTAEFVLQLLERINEKHRHDIVDSVCRVYPTLEHPRLKCDRTIISRLKTIACQPRGLVFIQGGNDESRTFLLSAIGYTFLSLTARPHRLVGLDAHEPDWFVPLPGVHYLGNLFHPAKLLQAARDNWPKLQVPETHLVVLNATGVLMADFQRQIRALTARCSVVVAEAAPVKPSLVKKVSHGPVHIVSVSMYPDNGKGIGIGIETV